MRASGRRKRVRAARYLRLPCITPGRPVFPSSWFLGRSGSRGSGLGVGLCRVDAVQSRRRISVAGTPARSRPCRPDPPFTAPARRPRPRLRRRPPPPPAGTAGKPSRPTRARGTAPRKNPRLGGQEGLFYPVCRRHYRSEQGSDHSDIRANKPKPHFMRQQAK